MNNKNSYKNKRYGIILRALDPPTPSNWVSI
jgi:hypothetical protein